MKISITGRHVDITNALNSYIKTKFQKLKKYSENIINIHTILTVEKERMKAEATLKTKNGNLYISTDCEQYAENILTLIEKEDLLENVF